MTASHSELCGCTECVDSYTATGQVEPCGWSMTVEWDLSDRIAHAHGQSADDVRALFGNSPDMPDEESFEYGEREMQALVARVEGKRFDSADELVRYLRQVTGTGDFD